MCPPFTVHHCHYSRLFVYLRPQGGQFSSRVADIRENIPVVASTAASLTGQPTGAPTLRPTDRPTQHPTTLPTTSEPTTSEPTTSEPTTSEPSTSPSAARGRLIPIQVPTAVSALDAASLDITVGWDADLDVGPVELVPRFAYLHPLAYLHLLDDASLVRASGENVMLQEPIHLNSSRGVTAITLSFIQSRVPMTPGV